MERRVLAGAAATFAVVVGGALVDFLTGEDFVVVVLGAGLAGGLVAGILSQAGSHVGAGARAGGYGGAAGFVAFVAVGAVQATFGGDLSVLYLGFQSLLVAVLVVPLYAVSGAVAAAVGVRLRAAIDRKTAA